MLLKMFKLTSGYSADIPLSSCSILLGIIKHRTTTLSHEKPLL